MAKSSKCVFVVTAPWRKGEPEQEYKFPTSINGWNKAAAKLDRLAHDRKIATLVLQCDAPGGGGLTEGKDEVVIAMGMNAVRFDVSPDTFNANISEDPDRALFGNARRARRPRQRRRRR